MTTTLLSWLLDYEKLGGKVVGQIPAGLPSAQFPNVDLDFNEWISLGINAFVIGLMGFVESMSIARSLASQTRQRLSSNQELIGQGLAKIVSGFFQGFVVSGSFSRTAVNHMSGARTGFSSIVTAGMVGLTLLFLTPLWYHLPLASLAAIIIVSLIKLFKVEPLIHAWRVVHYDGVVGVITFFATLIFAPALQWGVIVGVLLSLGLFLHGVMSPRLVEVAIGPSGGMQDVKAHNLKVSDSVSVYRFDGELFFANARYLEGVLLNAVAAKKDLKVLILDMESVDIVDSTGEEMLTTMVDRLHAVGIHLYFARTKLRIYQALSRSGFVDKIGEERFFRERKYAIKYAKEQLGSSIDIENLQHGIPQQSMKKNAP